MSEDAPGGPWSSDPTLTVDRVHVIESLPPDEQTWSLRTGARLAEELHDVLASTPEVPHLHVVRTSVELHAVLRGLVAEAEGGHFPLLHFETHGAERPPGRITTSVGLVLGSGEVFAWRQLAPYLTAINEATRLRLVVFMSACYGADVATLIQPLKRAPARVLLGPMRPITVGEIDKATVVFYRTLFRERNGIAAWEAMNAALQPGRDTFYAFTAEQMFLDILVSYFNELTTEPQIAARVEGMLAPLALAGVSPAELAGRRIAMRARMRDRKGIFDESYRTFFFVDKYPEIADRFRMTYESCFQEATSGRV